MQPIFSIVIPTRDRPNLLRDAIQSALNQDFDDYEIIVSDNSTNSKTEKVVSEFQSKKLKYFRTPKPLDMPKSWDFALSKANGKFITFLADDDLLPKRFLEFYLKVVNLKESKSIKVFSHGGATLSYIDEKLQIQNPYKGENYRLTFHILLGDRNVIDELGANLLLLDSKGVVNYFDAKHFFRWDLSLFLSWCRPHKSFFAKELYDLVRNKYGKCFFNWAPDITFPTIALYELAKGNNNAICDISIPLFIARDTPLSYGYGASRNPNKVMEFLHQFDEFKGTLMFSPFKDLFTVANVMYDSYLIAFNIVGEKEIYKFLGKNVVRDFHGRAFKCILKELENLSKIDMLRERYERYQIKLKRYFYFWRIKKFLLSLIQNRGYVRYILKSRLRSLLGMQNGGQLSYKISGGLNESLNVVNAIIEEKLKELG